MLIYPVIDIIDIVSEMDNNEIRLGYDIHAGFYFPDNDGIKAIIEYSPEKFTIYPTMIDEREQSGKNPFSPTQVYVEINGIPKRMRVTDKKSIYLSELSLDIERIKTSYRLLSPDFYESRIRGFVENTEAYGAKTLGDFIMKMSSVILNEQMQSLHNVSINEIKYDKFDDNIGHTEHSEIVHRNHDILYIALHKLSVGDLPSFERLAKKFRTSREEGKLLENPKYIITPQNPLPYFRM